MSFLASSSSLSSLLLLCCLSLVVFFALGKTVKITEGVHKLSTDSISTYTGSMASHTDTPPYVTPEALTGPAALHFLDGHCFETSYERWEYVVCPFQNVTQRRVLGMKTNVLGVWGHWRTSASLTTPASPVSIEDTSMAVSSSSLSPTHTQTHAQTERESSRVFSTMVFEDGKSCAEDQDSSSSTASAGPFVSSSVELVCDHAGPGVEVLSVDDSAFCAFSFKLGVPIACSLLTLDEGDVKHHRDLVKDIKQH